MGYTHYWRGGPETKEGWEKFLADARKIIADPQLAPLLAGRGGAGEPEIAADFVALNGKGEDVYETFEIENKIEEFNFCKTEHRPYDIVVCLLLIRAAVHFGQSFRVSSDGGWSGKGEWGRAKPHHERIFGEPAPRPFRS